MPISQIAAVDASITQFAATRSVETLPDSGASFSAYLARIMDPQQVDRADPGYRADASQSLAAPGASANDSATPADDRAVESQTQAAASTATRGSEDPQATASREAHERAAGDVKERKQEPEHSGAREKESVADAVEQRAASAEATAGAGSAAEPNGALKAKDRNGTARMAARVAASRELTDLKSGHADQGSVSGKAEHPQRNLPADTSGVIAAGGRAADKASPVAPDDDHAKTSGKVAITVIPVRHDSSSGSADGSPAAGNEPHKARKAVAGVEKSDRGLAHDDASATPSGKRSRFVVRDLRARQGAGDHKPSHDSAQAGKGLTAQSDGTDAPSRSDAGDSPSVFHNVQRTDDPAPAAARGTGAPAGLTSGTHQALRQTLNESVNGEIVKAARMVVRGNDTGEIRLHLKPETLGNVRILLQMQEGHIAGRIVVENSSVREVFEQNLSSLLRAFNESGISTGDVDVMLADSGSGDQAREETRPEPRAVGELDRAVPLVQTLDDRHELIDLVV